MILKRFWSQVKKYFLVININSHDQRIMFAKKIFHQIPINYAWKRKVRELIKKLLAPSYMKRKKNMIFWGENYPRLNETNHFSLFAQQLRIRRELYRRNNRTLVLLICRKNSTIGLCETLSDLYLLKNNKIDLMLLSDHDVVLEEGRIYPPFEHIKELRMESLGHYAETYSHLIVLNNGDRIKDFSIENLLYHLDSDQNCIGIYSDFRIGEVLHPLPDWDPVLIQFENYMTSPILFKFSKVIHILMSFQEIQPKTLKSSEDWDVWLSTILKRLHPTFLAHLPIDLFTLGTNRPRCSILENFPKKIFSLSIIIPTNGKKLSVLKNCLHSILTITNFETQFEIILLDNSRGQGHPDYYEYLEEMRMKKIRVYPYDLPFNWSAINNFGASFATGEILLFLNDDTEMTSADWITFLLETFSFPWVGIVAPRLVYPDGTIQHAGATLLPYGGGSANIGLGTMTIHDSLWNRNPRSVLTVMGACLATRRDLFQRLGGFDERYRIVLSETAYCLKAGDEGYHIVYTPRTTVIHHERASRKGIDPPEDEALFWIEWGHKILDIDPYYPSIFEKNPGSVKFELSERKMSLTVLESPYLYSDEIRNILILPPDSSAIDLASETFISNLKQYFPLASVFWVCNSHKKALPNGKEVVDKILDIDLLLDFKKSTSEMNHSMNDTLPEFDFAITLGNDSKTKKALENSRVALTVTPLQIASIGAENVLLARYEVSFKNRKFEKFRNTNMERGHTGSIPISLLPRRQFFPRNISPITIGMGTGSCPEEKKWPLGHFEMLARILLRVGFRVLLMGTAEDILSNAAIQKKLETIFPESLSNVTGKFGLSEIQSIVEEKCSLYVGNNSELTKMVASFGLPTIALFGGIVDPLEAFPPGEHVTVVFRDVPCAPCYSKMCSYDRECFEEVLPEDLLPLIWKKLNKNTLGV